MRYSARKNSPENSVGLAIVANPQPTGGDERSQAGTPLYSPRGRHYLTPVAHPLTCREPPPSPTAVADNPAVPADRADSALLRHRARDRAWLGRPQTGRPHGARRG